MTFKEAELNAKNIGIEKGIYSKEYADAVKQMNDIWFTTRKTKVERIVNKLCKLLWLKTQNNY